jgi:hypothetical protein
MFNEVTARSGGAASGGFALNPQLLINSILTPYGG